MFTDIKTLEILSLYIDRIFYMDNNEVKVVGLYGGIGGPPFFLCKWMWADYVYCADPLEVISMFDDNLNPIQRYKMEKGSD